MLGQVLSAVVTLSLYAMLGVPFAVWSGRSAFASARAHGGRPSRAATIWLAILPALFVLAYLASGIVDALGAPETAAGQPPGEWRPWFFLWLSPAAGMIVGYAAGAAMARKRGSRP